MASFGENSAVRTNPIDSSAETVTTTPSANTAIDGPLLWTALVVILGTVMSTLDTTIVNVAINGLSDYFDVSLATIQWVATGYMLALATVIPLTGWAADRFGTKRLYMASIALFAAGSALCGVAWSAEALVFFRILQGLAGGMILPAGIMILTHAAGPQRMGRIMGLVGVPMLLGPILGPILGGYFVDDVSWRWIFFINIPIAALALLTGRRSLETDTPKPHLQLDWKGFLLLSPGLAIFVYGLAELAASGSQGSTKAVAYTVIGLALLIGFVVHGTRQAGALIDVRLFARRTVAASAATNFLFGGVFFGASLLMPLYLQLVHDQSAFQAGLLVAIQGIGSMISMPISGKMTDKIGPGKIVLVGLVLFGAGIFVLSRINAETSLGQIELALFMIGLGVGGTMMPAMSAALVTLKREEVARATSGLNTILRIGGSIGVAVAAMALSYQLSNLVPAGAPQMDLAGAHHIPAAARAFILPGLSEVFAHTFLLLFGGVVLAFITALFLPRKAPEHAAVAELRPVSLGD